MNVNNMDFVYIIKPGEKGVELRYSIRSIAKWYPNHKIWIVGYKPTWLQNVEYLPVEQRGTKWTNSTNNVIAACKCEDISEDFILMNDDFFCINPTMPLEDIVNSNLGSLDKVINHYGKQKSTWATGFKYVDELLKELKIEKPLYSYEAHLPLCINKKKFLEVISLPEVQNFMKTSKILHKRTLYKNYDKPEKIITIKADTKITKGKDNSESILNVCGWLSTADGLVGNPQFGKLNQILYTNLFEPCIYEKPVSKKIKSKEKFINY